MKTPGIYIIEHDETGEKHEGTAGELAAIIHVVPQTINKMALQGGKISKHWTAIKKPKEKPVEKEKHKCKNCGKEFIPRRKSQIFCSIECCENHHERQMKAVLRENTQFKDGKVKKRPKPKHSVVDVAVAARKAGMSYGQYVARMGL